MADVTKEIEAAHIQRLNLTGALDTARKHNCLGLMTTCQSKEAKAKYHSMH